MPWTYRRLAGSISLVGGSLALTQRVHPPASTLLDQTIARFMEGVWALRSTLNGLGSGLVPGAGNPSSGLGDLVLFLALAGLVVALLHERPPSWVQDVRELVSRWDGRSRPRRRSPSPR